MHYKYKVKKSFSWHFLNHMMVDGSLFLENLIITNLFNFKLSIEFVINECKLNSGSEIV